MIVGRWFLLVVTLTFEGGREERKGESGKEAGGAREEEKRKREMDA